MDIKEIRKKKFDTEVEIAKLLSKFEEETGLDVSAVDYQRTIGVYTSSLAPIVDRIVELKILI